MEVTVESETKPPAGPRQESVTIYFDHDKRVVEGNDPDVAFARRITFDDGVIVKVEFLKITPPAAA
jgi:hypothetical protein